MPTNPNIILAGGSGRPQSVDYNSARNVVFAGEALKSKQEQQDRQQAMQAQRVFQTALQQTRGDYDQAIAQSEQQGYDMTPVRMARSKLQEQIYKAGNEQLTQHKTEDDLIGRIFNTMDASDPVSVTTGTQMLMRVDPHGGWDQIVGQNPTKEHIAQLSGLGMTAKEHADLVAKSLESMKAGDWMGYLAAGKKSSNSPEDWQQVTALGARLGIAPEMIAHVEQMTPDQLDDVLKVKPTKETAAKVGSFEDYVTRTYGDNPTPAQILAARKAYQQADDRPPQVRVSVAGGAASTEASSDAVRGYKNDLISGALRLTDIPAAGGMRNAVRGQLEHEGYDLNKPLNAQAQARVDLAKLVLPQVNQVREMAKKIDQMGLMGTTGGRWRSLTAHESMADAIGGLTPQQRQLIGQFVSQAELLTSGTAITHYGARAGGATVEHLREQLDPKNKSLDTYLGNLQAVQSVLGDYAKGLPGATKQGESQVAPVTDTPATGGTVRMRAPNGQMKDVPADRVDFYKSKGAVVVK